VPSRYMRARRPHLFSDSQSRTEHSISREVLSYHLETLTNQKDETKFEEFARRLGEKFISPNLRPQTGPTGGGDGKTDAETYPVSSEIALRWFVSDLQGARERWAFAFSAKKDWRSKVQADVSAIAGTARGYFRAYFVSNQFVPAKACSEVQDALTAKHNLQVTILDRTWILEKVFNGNSLDIAIEALGVADGGAKTSKTMGPRDTERTAELTKLEISIADPSNYEGSSQALVEDCERAALLARSLERPRDEIDGKFLRAQRLDKEKELGKLQLSVTYNWAWTTYFWFDDAKRLSELYDGVELLASGSNLASEVELLTNLWPALQRSVALGSLSPEQAKLDARGEVIQEALKRVSEDSTRPNNALHARSSLLFKQVMDRVHADRSDPMVDIWEEFREILRRADGLGTFPLVSITDCLTELGELLPESEPFDRLYEEMADIVAIRSSEGEGAKKNGVRAFQKLRKKLPYEAIRWFGRAAGLLVKEEYQTELCDALVGSSFAYEQAGLLWAARNYALAAASQQFALFEKTGSIDHISPAVLRRYFCSELRLGRVPQILHAYEFEMMVRNAQAKTNEQRAAVRKAQSDLGGVLGALLLRTDFSDLCRIAALPDALERHGLMQGRTALLFLMGHIDTLAADGSVPAEEMEAGYLEFFEDWSSLGDRFDLPTRPDYVLADVVRMKSRVVGSEIVVEAANNLVSIGIGEGLLGALESFLATSLFELLPKIDRLEIRVSPSSADSESPVLTFIDESGTTVGIVSHSGSPEDQRSDDAFSFPRWLKGAVVDIFARLTLHSDPEDWGKRVVIGENAFSRAVTFSNTPLMLRNFFGGRSRLSVIDWMVEDDVSYDLTRSQAWVPKENSKAPGNMKAFEFGEGEPPEQMFERETTKHSDYHVVSPIDVDKWNAAKWDATVFEWALDDSSIPPVLGIAFVNNVPAAKIFQAWRSRFGMLDEEEALRVTIVRGISLTTPNAYTVLIGPALDTLPLTTRGTVGFVSRINRMYPSSSRNLDSFIAQYHRRKSYLLVPFHFPSRGSIPEPMSELALGKRRLSVREAWTIGENDPDVLALRLDDPPYIPSHVANAPVLKALRRMAALARAHVRK
jgi:hypothetical protein